MARRSSARSTQVASSTASLGHFEHLTGTDRGKQLEIPRERSTVGRTLDNDVVLPSDAVSRCHAEIVVSGTGLAIRDLRSKNGVLVNGKRVREHRLVEGDIVQIGNFLLRFHDGAAQEPELRPVYSDAPQNATFAAAPTQANYAPPPRPMMPFEESRAAMGSIFRNGSDRSRFTTYSIVTAFVFGVLLVVLGKRGGPPTVVRNTTTLQPLENERWKADIDNSNTPEPDPLENQVIAPRSFQPRVPNPPQSQDKMTLTERAGLATNDVAAMDDAQALEVYVREGRAFLERGDFENAAKAFQIALVIDPRNAVAMKGIRAAEFRTKDLEKMSLEAVPSVVRPRKDTMSKKPRVDDRAARKRVADLFEKARAASNNGRYTEAIDAGETVRAIELRGDTSYLNEAKQIIDRARERQKTEFEPFVERANQLLKEGKTQEGVELCEQMLRQDPGYQPAKACAQKGGTGGR